MIFRSSKKNSLLNLTNTNEVQTVDLEVGLFARSQTNLNTRDKVKLYFEQLREPVFRYLISTFGGEHSRAEEITQDAFLQLYRSMDKGDNIQNVQAWIFRVAHNLAQNQIKTQKFIAVLNDEDWNELEQSLEDNALNPEQVLLKKEKMNRLRRAINRLTEIERQCLNLRTKGFRYREIGEILGIGTTTVSDTLTRVIEKLLRETNG